MKVTDTTISVIGLGKLGMPILAAAAKRGFKVLGYDVNKTIRNKLLDGKYSSTEPDLNELLVKYKKNYKISEDINSAVLGSSITFVITPTPSTQSGGFSTEYVEPVLHEVASALKEKEDYHLVVLVSTVLPGTVSNLVGLFETASAKICGKDFGFCYNPEFIALGSVINNLLNPDFVLVGESDKKTGDILEDFYKSFCEKPTLVARMNFVNAELCKISVNTFVTTKISYANMLAEICSRLPGGDVDVITSAMGNDTRIGKKYLCGGMAFGGPCFPRDNIAFLHLADSLGIVADIPKATYDVNLRNNIKLAKQIRKLVIGNKSLGILGMSYKPDTDVVEESAALYVVNNQLLSTNINLYDPKAIDNCRKQLKDKVTYYDSLKKCVEDSDVILISTLWKEIVDMNLDWFSAIQKKVVVDPWRKFKGRNFPSNVEYVAFGLG